MALLKGGLMAVDVGGAGAPYLGSLRTTASHTIGVSHLIELLDVTPMDATFEHYRCAVVEDNVLGRASHAGRLRTFRHLRELYHLDPAHPEFRALRVLWTVDPSARPLIAGLLAFTRDELFRASWPAISRTLPEAVVTSLDVSNAVAETYAGGLSTATLGKIGRNIGSCWTQTGHLTGRSRKIRTSVEATPAAIAFVAYLGYLSGGRALRVLDNPWSPLLDLGEQQPLDALRHAHDAGLVDLQVAGHVVEVGFSFIEGNSR